MRVRRNLAPGRTDSAAPAVAVIILVVTAVLSAWPMVAPGHPTSVDAWPHLARQKIVYDAFKTGTSPFYTFAFYCGFPALRFYSPLFYLLGGTLTVVLGGRILLALRVLLVVLHLLSAWAMFTLIRRRSGSVAPAALGSMVYLLVPWRVFYLCGSANYPAALIYLLLPLAALALERVLETGAARDGVWLGLAAAALLLSHLVYALFGILLFVLFLAFRPQPAPRRSPAVALGVALVTGFCLAACFVVPFLLEYRSHAYPQPRIAFGTPLLSVLLGLKTPFGGYKGVYLGVSSLLLAAVAVGALIARRAASRHWPAALGLAAALGLTFAPAILKNRQDIITAGLPPERFLLFYVFFAALLAPAAFELLNGALKKLRSGALAAFLVLAVPVAADCLLPLLHFHYSNPDFLAVRRELYPLVNAASHARTIDINTPEWRIDDLRRICRHPSANFVYGNLASPLGLPFHQFAPRSMLYVYPWVSYVAQDLGSAGADTLTDNTLKALALMGASHVITLPGKIHVQSPEGDRVYALLKKRIPWFDRFVAAHADPPLALGHTGAGLLLAARTVTPMPRESLAQEGTFIVAADWRRLLDTLTLDPGAGRLNFIPVAAGEVSQTLPGEPSLAIAGTTTAQNHIEVDATLDVESFLRLAVSYYPELIVSVDGKPVRFLETADHFVWFRCPAGSHRIVVTAGLTPVRRVTAAISGISLVLAALFLALDRRRRKLHHPAAPVDH